MALTKITNTFSEYAFDDFDETKNYHRVLYKPGVSVQARELTQMQTALQRQIDYHGQYSFVDGARVVGANLSIDVDYDYIKVEDVFHTAQDSAGSITTSAFLADLKGCTLISPTTGRAARVVQVITGAGVDANNTTDTGILDNNSGDPITLYIKYLKAEADGTVNNTTGDLNGVSGDTGIGFDSTDTATSDHDADVANDRTFNVGEVLKTTNAPGGTGSTTRYVRVGGITGTTTEYVGTTPSTSSTITSAQIGKGSIAHIEEGSFFISGTFVYVADQKIVLEKYSGTPTTLIGLNVVESVVGSGSDTTLLDNATGFPNASAPGADRYKIAVTLVKTATSNATFDNFIQLSSLVLGIAQSNAETIVQKTNTEFADRLARRTFEESGNYTLSPFKFDIREHLDDEEGNGGLYPASGGVIAGSADHIAFGVEPNVAYVNGYRYEHIANEYIKIPKTRDASHQVAAPSTNFDLGYGNYFKSALSSVDGIPNVNSHTVATLQHASNDDGICHFTSITNYVVDSRTEASFTLTHQNAGNTWVKTAADGTTSNVAIVQGGTAGSSAGAKLKITIDKAGATKVEILESGSGYNINNTFTLTSATLGTGADMVLSGAILGMGTCRIRDMAFEDASNVRLYVYDIKITGSASNETLLSDVTIINQVNAGDSNTSGDPFTATITPTLFETGNNQLVFPTPFEAVKDVASGSVKPLYQVRRKFTGNKSGDAIEFTLGSNETFIFDGQAYLATGSAAPVLLTASQIANGTDKITVTVSGTTGQVQLIATVQKDGAGSARKSKTETFVTEQEIKFDGTNNALLNKADVNKILAVYEKPASRISLAAHGSAVGTVGGFTIQMAAVETAPIRAGMVVSLADASLASSGAATPKIFGTVASVDTSNDIVTLVEALTEVPANGATLTFDIDVSANFKLDKGHRPNFYEESALVPVGAQGAVDLLVKYSYYVHGAGDYFAAESYPDYDEIPVFESFDGILELRDSLDFRPLKGTNGGVKLGDEFDTGDVSIGNQPAIPKPNSNVIADIDYYVGRTDKIVLDRGGNYKVVTGVPSEDPIGPDDLDDAMTIAELKLGPYIPFLDGYFDVETFNYKRYTMKDIGSIEKRVDSLEYYTSLNLLENQTSNEHIVDGSSNNRFKNGMFVDPFSGHQNADADHPDYLIAIDRDNGTIRPHSVTEMIEMERLVADEPTGGEGSAITAEGNKGSRIVNTNNIYTLPYTFESLIKQDYASRTIPVNPYNIFTFTGTMELSPSSDIWRETHQRPDIVRDNEGVFNTMLSRIKSENTLGTIWNEWETEWVGQNPDSRQGRSSGAAKGRHPRFRNITTSAWRQTSTTRTGTRRRRGRGRVEVRDTFQRSITQREGQTRTGIENRVRIDTTREVIGNRTVATSFVPFIRSRVIAFNAQLMKPNTRVYPFFGDKNVSAYCRRTGTAARFYGRYNLTGWGNRYFWWRWRYRTSLYRRIFGRRRRTWFGFPVTGGYWPSAWYRTTTALITDSLGRCDGWFLIPNNRRLRFKAGKHTFRLTDSKTNNKDTETTFAEADYTARGIISHRQRTILSTRIPRVESREVTQNRITNRTRTETRTRTRWIDPLAQTFLIDQPGGLFMGQIKIFVAQKDSNIPLNISIREVENGIPTQKVVPGTDMVVYPADINLAGSNGATPTTVNFHYPVYLSEDTEYAIVLISQSDKYSVFIAEQGQRDIANARHRINKQPYNGVFFTSQNASTWTPEQNKDLKFELLRCKFSIDTDSNMDAAARTVNFVNQNNAFDELPHNPFTYLTATTIRVSHPNHGMYCGAQSGASNLLNKVKFQGYPAGENGLASSLINDANGFYVHDIEHDSYCFTHTGTATTHGGLVGGGSDIDVSEQIQYNSLFIKNESLEVPDTAITVSMEGRSGKSLDGANVIGGQAMNYALITGLTLQGNATNHMPVPMVVANSLNETAMQSTANGMTNGTASTHGNSSLAVSCVFSSESNFLTPIIDGDRSGVFAITNRTNDASGYNQYKPDGTTQNYHYAADGANTASTSSTQNSFYNNTTDGRTFISNTKTGGTSDINSYITKTVTLADPAEVLRVMASVSKPTDSDVYLYYKTFSTDQADIDFDTVDWIYASPTTAIPESDLGAADVEWNLTPAEKFSFFVFKIVLVTKNSSSVPQVGAFRAIAAT